MDHLALMLVMKNSYILGGQKCIAKISDIFIEFPLFSNTFHLVYQYAHNVIFFALSEKDKFEALDRKLTPCGHELSRM